MKTLTRILSSKGHALIVTGILVAATLAYAYISAKIGVDYAATMLLIGIIGGALVLVLSVGVVFAVWVVAVLIDRIVRLVRR